MKRLLRCYGLRVFLGVLGCTLALLLYSPDAHAQQWRGAYCLQWNQQIRPSRVIASGHVRAGETVNLIIPPPTLPDSIQYVALSWGTDMNMPDTQCTYRVVQASGSYLLQPPTAGATLWEWQIVEVDVRTYDPRNPATPVPASQGLREMPVPASVQASIAWALQSDILLWVIGVPLGVWLARDVIYELLHMARSWFEDAESGDREHERYLAERNLVYDEDLGEYVRADRE